MVPSDGAVGCVLSIRLPFMWMFPLPLLGRSGHPACFTGACLQGAPRCPRVPFPRAFTLWNKGLTKWLSTTQHLFKLRPRPYSIWLQYPPHYPAPLWEATGSTCCDFSLGGGRSSTKESGFDGWKQPKAIQSQEWGTEWAIKAGKHHFSSETRCDCN